MSCVFVCLRWPYATWGTCTSNTAMFASPTTDKLNFPPGLLAPSPSPGLKKNQAGSPCCFPGCFSFVHKGWLKQAFQSGHSVYYGSEHDFSRLLTCSMVTEGDGEDDTNSPRESVLSNADTVVDTDSTKECVALEKVPPQTMSSIDSSSPRTMSPPPPVPSPLPQPTLMMLPPTEMQPQQPLLAPPMPPPHQQHPQHQQHQPFGFFQQFPALPPSQFMHHQAQQQQPQPPHPEYNVYGYISASKKLLVQRIESGLHSGRFLGTVQFSSTPNNDCPGFLVYLPICWFHLNSVCHFGSKCKNAHEKRKNWKLATWTDIHWFLNASVSQIRDLDDDFKHQSAIKRTIDH